MGFIKSCLGKCPVSGLQSKAFPSQDAYQLGMCFFQMELEHRGGLFLTEGGRKEKLKPSWKAVLGFFIIALGCKSYKCAERKQTLKHQKEPDESVMFEVMLIV